MVGLILFSNCYWFVDNADVIYMLVPNNAEWVDLILYKNKDINGRIAHLSDDQKNIDHFYDKYIGINNLHPELVTEIKELIKQ